MFEVIETDVFTKWIKKVKDPIALASIYKRIDRISDANFGDRKSLGDGVTELRIDVGAGYRLYFTIREQRIVILLAGGAKKTQTKDIKLAKKLAKEY